MKIEAVILILALLVSMVFISGCGSQQQTPIKSQEDVTKSLDNVGGGVEKVSGILTDVDKVLGGG